MKLFKLHIRSIVWTIQLIQESALNVTLSQKLWDELTLLALFWSSQNKQYEFNAENWYELLYFMYLKSIPTIIRMLTWTKNDQTLMIYPLNDMWCILSSYITAYNVITLFSQLWVVKIVLSIEFDEVDKTSYIPSLTRGVTHVIIL